MSESIQQRLARLRREVPPATPAPAELLPDAPLPQWWRARMAKRVAQPVHSDAPRELAPPADLLDASNARGAFAFRETRFALTQRHGGAELESVLAVRAELFALVAKDARLAALDPERALFLDIETTGLAGGAGTKAFLVGLGRIERGEFVLWQGFLRGPEQEAALLLDVAERVADVPALVTFFGKSFDRHRLEDKMRVHGVAPPFEGRPHLDLYHPLRALYRPALDDARLGTLERVLCGVERSDDLSGAFAPEAWHDFLAGRPHRLERVFAHNRDDVLSLVTLCAHLGSLDLVAAAPAEHAPESLERRLETARLRGLVRALAHAKRWGECAELARACLALAPPAAQCAELEALEDVAARRLRRAAGKRRRPEQRPG